MNHPSNALKKWFLESRRDLPWRSTPTPYAVWVSEVMLQQTQVTVVIPYFERWMERFPTIASLAEAPLDTVIKMWEGLGYYSRARNLHHGAKQVMEHFNGELPSTKKELQTIKGLGPYTIGAILSFAFHQKVAALDGNVIRVLARYYAIDEDVSKQSTLKLLQKKAEEFLPDHEPWLITEGLIELGAIICQKQPACENCPLKARCQAYQQGLTTTLPIKAKRQSTISLHRAVAVITHNNHFLIQRGQEGKVMSDLHEFPYFETTPAGLPPTLFQEQIKEHLGLSVTFQGLLPEIKHSFTRYRVRLMPAYFVCEAGPEIPNHHWKTKQELDQLAFSSGHRKLYQSL